MRKIYTGLHYFGKRGNNWAVWCYDFVDEVTGFATAKKVKTCYSYQDALKTIYLLNGWGVPKQIKRKF